MKAKATKNNQARVVMDNETPYKLQNGVVHFSPSLNLSIKVDEESSTCDKCVDITDSHISKFNHCCFYILLIFQYFFQKNQS